MSEEFCSSSKRGSVSEYLHHDLIIKEILLRIPAEFLLVCKSVSKDWLKEIQSSDFANKHHEFHHATKEESIGLVLIAHSEDGTIYDLTITHKWHEIESETCRFLRGRGSEKLLKIDITTESMSLRYMTCNGLVCFHENYPLHLCNPVTREFVRTLPEPRHKEECSVCGFGFDATAMKYKLVQLFRGLDGSLDCEVLTLGKSSLEWRKPIQKQDKIPHPSLWCHETCQGSVFVDGSLYWNADSYILCFNVTTELFKKILVPMPRYIRMLAELDGSLCIINQSFSEERLNIWKMPKDCVGDDNVTWKSETIDVSHTFCIPDDSYMKPVCSRGNNIYLQYENGLAFYNRQTKDLATPVFLVGADYIDFVAYTKSIVSLKHMLGPALVSILG